MVYIITKDDGPRKEDVAARKLIEGNRQTIHQLANHLTGGRWQEIRQARAAQAAAPAPERRTIAGYVRPADSDARQPYVRISPNNRVVVVDAETSRQLLFLGELRREGQGYRFRLATRGNGFFDPLTGEALDLLSDIDGIALHGDESLDPFRHEIGRRLGLAAA